TSNPYFPNSPWSRATQIGSVSALMKAWATLILRGAPALAAALDPPAGAAAPELPGAALPVVGVLALPVQPASSRSTSTPASRTAPRPSQPPRPRGDATILPFTAPPPARRAPNCSPNRSNVARRRDSSLTIRTGTPRP